MSKNIYTAEDFTEEEIYDFVDKVPNHYDTFVSAADVPAVDRATTMNDWKAWLWLEREGFDFWETCWHEMIRHHLYLRSHNWYEMTDEEAYDFDAEDDLVLPEHMARRMQFHVRNRMRDVWQLPRLPEGEYQRSLTIDPLFRTSPGYRVKPDGPEYDMSSLPSEYPAIEAWIEEQAPFNIELLKKEGGLCRQGYQEYIQDNYTPNGEIELFHYKSVFRRVYGKTINGWIVKYLEQFHPDMDEYWQGGVTWPILDYLFEKYAV
jgi:hypothetical protein